MSFLNLQFIYSTCTEPTLMNCLQCPDTTKCDECESGFFVDTTSAENNQPCTPCDPKCTNCISLTSCNECKSSFYLSGPECKECLPDCDICSNATACDSCPTGTNKDPTSGCIDCTRGYYLMGESCLQCEAGCVECHNITQCEACEDSNKDPNTNCSSCLPGFFLDGSQTCSMCADQCSTCHDSSSGCTACSNPLLDIGKNCLSCQQANQFFDGTTCIACAIQCSTCQNSAENCITCKIPELDISQNCLMCKNPNQFLDGFICEDCISICSSCQNSADNCTACSDPLLDLSSKCLSCIKPSQFYDGTTCVDCSSKCETCEGSAENCITFATHTSCEYPCKTCNADFSCKTCSLEKNIDENTCLCLPGFFDNGNECIECLPECGTCKNASSCLTCQGNRELNGSGLCQCPGTSMDHFEQLGVYTCTTCEQVVMKHVGISNDYTVLTLSSFVGLSFPGFKGQWNEYSTELCEFILDDIATLKYGSKPKCQYNEGYYTLSIQLGYGNSIDIGESVKFKANTLQQAHDCDEKIKISSIHNTPLDTPTKGEAKKPEISSLKVPTGSVSICEEISIEILEAQFDAGRGLTNHTWILLNPKVDPKNLIQTHLNTTAKSLSYLTFPPTLKLLSENTQYQFNVTFQNDFGIIGFKEFQIETAGNKGISVQVVQTEKFIFSNWKINEITANIAYMECGSVQGNVNNKEFGVEWIDVTEGQAKNIKPLEYTFNPTSSFSNTKHQFAPGSYQFKIRAFLKDQPDIESSQIIDVQFSHTPLGVFIKGGDNRMLGFTSPLKLEGSVKDMDQVEEDQETGITIGWQCKNLVNNLGCTDPDGNPLQLNTTKTLNYPEKHFEPFKSYQFTLTGQKAGQTQQEKKVTIVITDNNLPVLEAGVSEQILNQQVNTNDDLSLDISEEDQNEQLSYSLQLIYKFEVVATKKFGYKSVAYKIWDLFNDFQLDDNSIQVKVSVYNPKFVMPQQSSFTLKVNLEPIEGNFIIDKTQGESLNTEFNIQLTEFKDEDQPLSYKYQFYLKPNDYEDEKIAGSDLLTPFKNVYQDFSNKNSIKMILPRGDFNTTTNKSEILLMVSVSDSKGAIRNVTKTIEVEPVSGGVQQQIDAINTKMTELDNLPKTDQISIINVLSLEITRLQESDCTIHKCNGNGKCLSETNQCQCNKGFYFKDCSGTDKNAYDKYKQLKTNIDGKIQELSSENVPKAIKDQMLKSQNSIVADQDVNEELDQEEVKKQITNTESILEQQQDIILDLIEKEQINQGDSKGSRKLVQVKQSLGNSLKFLDGVYFGLTSKEIQSQSAENQQQQSTNSTTQTPTQGSTDSDQSQNEGEKDTKKLQNKENIYHLNKKAAKILQKVILPNSDPVEHFGKSIRTSIAVNTKKELTKKFFFEYNMEENRQPVFVGFSELLDGEQNNGPFFEVGLPQGIGGELNNAQNSYRSNPFQYQGQFPYSNQSTTVQDFSITEKGKDENINITKPVNMRFGGDRDEEENKQMVCIQRKNEDWNDLDCETVSIKKDNGKFKLECKCKSLNPTTIINDLGGLFKNSMAGEVFSDKGLEALADFQFWKTFIFYLYLVKFSILIVSIRKGFTMDKVDFKKKKEKDLEEELQKQKEEQEKNQDIEAKNLNKQQKTSLSTISDIDFQKTEVNQSEIEIQKNISPIKLSNTKRRKNQSQFQLSEPDKKGIRTLINLQTIDLSENQYNNGQYTDRTDNTPGDATGRSLTRKQPRSSKKFNLQTEREIGFDMNINSIDEIDESAEKSLDVKQQKQQLKSKNDKKEQKKPEKTKFGKEQLREVSEGLFRLHSYFGIFLVFDDKMNRPKRFVLYYLRIHQLLAASALFSQELDQLQSCLLSLLVALFLGIPEAILSVFMKKNNKCLQMIGFLFYLAIYLATVYTIMVTAALMGYEKANEWMISYFLSFSLDSFMVETMANFAKIYFIRQELMSGKRQLVSKIFGNDNLLQFLKKQI